MIAVFCFMKYHELTDMSNRSSIYLDYAASTPVDSEVLAAMQPFYSEVFGNPGSLHSFGQEASAALFKARRSIAESLGVSYEEIVFTGSATEANNLALRGVVKRALREGIKNPRIVLSSIEHEAVLETAQDLERDGVEIVVLPTPKSGVVQASEFKKAINGRTVLASLMLANNEIGTVQPVAQVAKLVAEARGEGMYPLMHTDAVQGFQYLDCDVEKLGVDLMTLSSHKIYGPKGIGLLYIRGNDPRNPKFIRTKHRLGLEAVITGGGQEEGLRSGTENVASVVGFAKAIELVEKKRKAESLRVEKLRDWFLKELLKVFKDGSVNGSRGKRLPNNISFNLTYLLSEQALTFFDMNGVAISAGSACSARSLEPSATLRAIGLSDGAAKRSVRMTLGRQTTKAELKKVLAVCKKLKKTFA